MYGGGGALAGGGIGALINAIRGKSILKGLLAGGGIGGLAGLGVRGIADLMPESRLASGIRSSTLPNRTPVSVPDTARPQSEGDNPSYMQASPGSPSVGRSRGMNKFEPQVSARVEPIGETTPRKQFEKTYGEELTEELFDKAHAAQQEWQDKNPDKLISPIIPSYTSDLTDRTIKIYPGRIGQSENTPLSEVNDLNALYVPGLNPEGGFIDNAPPLGRFDNTSEKFDQLSSNPKVKELIESAIPGFWTRRLFGDFRSYVPGAGKASPGAFVGQHEATHALQNFAGAPASDLQAMPSGHYGLRPIEFPAHLSELKARYFKDTGTVPFMDQLDQRLSFMNYLRRELDDSSNESSSSEKTRYQPIMEYLQNADPEEQEFLLRSIVSRQPYSEYQA
jgi:hypothetical protein